MKLPTEIVSINDLIAICGKFANFNINRWWEGGNWKGGIAGFKGEFKGGGKAEGQSRAEGGIGCKKGCLQTMKFSLSGKAFISFNVQSEG